MTHSSLAGSNSERRWKAGAGRNHLFSEFSVATFSGHGCGVNSDTVTCSIALCTAVPTFLGVAATFLHSCTGGCELMNGPPSL